MKNLSPVWFLQSPIDAEQKHYILLAFLQEVNKEIKINNVYSPVKRIFSLIKELDYFIKCPYCRSIQFTILPYHEELALEQKYGVNSLDKKLPNSVSIHNISSLSHRLEYVDKSLQLCVRKTNNGGPKRRGLIR